MRLSKPLAIAAAGLVLVGGAGVAYGAAAPEPAKSYGGCVSKSTGYVRVLERNNLAKSVNGACKSTERKITWYSRSGIPFPARLVFKRPGATDTCVKDAAASTSGAWTFNCTLTVLPTPTPTSTATS